MHKLSATTHHIAHIPSKKISGQRVTQSLLSAMYVIGLAGFGVVSFVPGIIGLSSRDVTIPFRAFTLGIAIIILLLALHYRLIRKGWGISIFMLFWMLYLTRILVDTYLYPIYLARSPEIYLLFGMGISMVPALAFFTIPDFTCLRRAMRTLYLFMNGIGAAAIINGINAFFLNSRLSRNEICNPISLGHIGASICILSIFIFLQGQTKFGKISLSSLITLTLGLAIIALSGARGPALAFVVAIMILVWFYPKRKKKLRLLFVLFLFLLLVPFLINKTTKLGGSFLNRINFLRNTENVKNDIRANLWINSLKDLWQPGLSAVDY